MSAVSGRYSPNTFVSFGSASVGTAIQSAWTPGTGKAIRLMGCVVGKGDAGVLQVDLTLGTAAAAGTLATLTVAASGPMTPLDLGYRR